MFQAYCNITQPLPTSLRILTTTYPNDANLLYPTRAESRCIKQSLRLSHNRQILPSQNFDFAWFFAVRVLASTDTNILGLGTLLTDHGVLGKVHTTYAPPFPSLSVKICRRSRVSVARAIGNLVHEARRGFHQLLLIWLRLLHI